MLLLQHDLQQRLQLQTMQMDHLPFDDADANVDVQRVNEMYRDYVVADANEDNVMMDLLLLLT